MTIPEGYVQCDKCKDYFSKFTIKRHSRTCDGVTGNTYLRAQDRPSFEDFRVSKDEFKCPYCGKIFKSQGIGGHVWRSHGEGKDFNPNKGFAEGTRVAWNKGLTKETSEAVAQNGQSIHESRYNAVFTEDWQKALDDDGKLHQKYCMKKSNAQFSDVECKLTFLEYCMLMRDAGIVSSDLGYSGKNYVLARYCDSGDYTYDNCRFISQKENIDERSMHSQSKFSPCRVKCIEDDLEFSTMTEANQYYSLNATGVSDAIRYYNGYVKSIDKHFVKLDVLV